MSSVYLCCGKSMRVVRVCVELMCVRVKLTCIECVRQVDVCCVCECVCVCVKLMCVCVKMTCIERMRQVDVCCVYVCVYV